MTGEVGPMKVKVRPSASIRSLSMSPSLGFSEACPQPTMTASTFWETHRSTMSCTLA